MSRSIIDLTPEMQVLANKFLADCTEASIDVMVTCTFRSFEEQDDLYAKGRTTPGSIVTKARGGESPHNYGMAFDIVPIEHGKPVWDTTDPIWAIVGILGQAAGLEWGGAWTTFKDLPHFQRPNWKEYIGVTKT